MHHHDPDDPQDTNLTETDGDEDREAILARRQQFIALALVGLSGAAGSCASRREPPNAPPQVAEESDENTGGETGEAAADGAESVDTPPPRPTEEYAPSKPKRRRWTSPRACLRVALPEDEAP